MARILCLTSGLTGIAFASFALVRRLEASGHRVTYACPKPIAALAEANGMSYVQLPALLFDPAPSVPAFEGPGATVRRWVYRWTHYRSRRRIAVNSVSESLIPLRQLLTELKPELVIVDVELHEYLMTTIARGVPTILLSQWFSLWPSPGLPPLHHTTIPGEGWRGARAGLALAWWQWRWQRRLMFAKKFVRSGGTNRRAILKTYAKAVGFPLDFAPANYWPGPFTYYGLPVWSMTMQEMEFPHQPQPRLTYVGPMVNPQRSDPRVPPEARQQLARALQYQTQRGAKLICCTVSSFKQGDPAFLRKLVRAAGQHPEWVLLLALGGQFTAADFGSLPANVFAFSWLPQLEALAKADLSINHGGIHTIQECLHFRVPMLIYSGKRSDQNGCAARVHYHQLGLMADKDEDDSTAIALRIRRLLREDVFRTRLASMRQYYQAYQESDVLSRSIQTLLNNHLDEHQAETYSTGKKAIG